MSSNTCLKVLLWKLKGIIHLKHLAQWLMHSWNCYLLLIWSLLLVWFTTLLHSFKRTGWEKVGLYFKPPYWGMIDIQKGVYVYISWWVWRSLHTCKSITASYTLNLSITSKNFLPLLLMMMMMTQHKICSSYSHHSICMVCIS